MKHSPSDFIWVLTSGILVFMMQAGFMCLEVGLVRQKNSINVAIKNVTDFLISSVAFFLVGFAFMFGTSAHGLIGIDGWALSKYIRLDQEGWIYVFWFFQVVFCGASATIVSGSVAERMRFGGYMIISAIISTFIYPVFGHWAWGGNYELAPTQGWLNALGYKDFAGSSVVHMVGGVTSLACLLILGPRRRKYDKNGSVNKIWGCDIPMSTLGVFLLWFGWFGFNGGSTLAMNKNVGLIIINTNLAACTGALSCLFFTWMDKRLLDVESIINGSLGGLVAITASCAYVTPVSALLIGTLAGPVLIVAAKLLDRFHIDDAVEAIPVHAACGMLGILCVGVFAEPQFLVNGSRGQQILVQSLGLSICFVYTFAAAWAPMKFIDRYVTKLRVPPDDEDKGLNVSEHGARTLWLEIAEEMQQIERTDDLSRRVEVEPHTEAGTVAAMFNKLMDALQKKTKAMKDSFERLLESEKNASELKDRMIHSEKMSAVGQLVGGVAHEINNPLGIILGFAQSLRAEFKARGESNVALDYIEREALRCKALVQNLLIFSRSSRLDQREETDFVFAIEEVLSLIATQTRVKNIRVDKDFERGLPRISINKVQIQQIIINLCNNAVDAMPEGGTLSLSAGQTARNGRTQFFLRVSDTGTGIPKDVQARIFEPFFTTKEVGKGTGLGLSLVYEIIQWHEGTIDVESEPGKGTTFTIHLPATLQQQREAA